jgi:hypothetical protein
MELFSVRQMELIWTKTMCIRANAWARLLSRDETSRGETGAHQYAFRHGKEIQSLSYTLIPSRKRKSHEYCPDHAKILLCQNGRFALFVWLQSGKNNSTVNR